MSNRTAIISYTLTNAWEAWSIEITDPEAPEEITPEWIRDNPQGWEYVELKDSGHDHMVTDSIEVEEE